MACVSIRSRGAIRSATQGFSVKFLCAALACVMGCFSVEAAAKKPVKASLVPPIDLNRASPRDLQTLPGVGSATAKRIIAGRPYSSVQDLARVGVPAKTIAAIAPSATASSEDRFFNTSGSGVRGMVWVNLETKHYHKENSRWYGKTKNGKYMTEADAQRAGYKASRE